MSWQAVQAVIDRSEHSGSRRLLLLVIAAHAHDDGSGSFASQPVLAYESNLSVRQVRRLIHQIEASGELRVLKRSGSTDLLTVVPGKRIPPPGVRMRKDWGQSLPTPDVAMSGVSAIET